METPAYYQQEADKAIAAYKEALNRQSEVTAEVEEASERAGERADLDYPIITPAMRARLNRAKEQVEQARARAFKAKLAANMAGILAPAQ